MTKLDISTLDNGVLLHFNNNHKPSHRPMILSVIIGLCVGVVNGFFGGGGGMICVPALSKIYGLEDKVAHATTLFVMLPLSIISAVIYVIKGNAFHSNMISIILGVIIGGILGSILLKKLSNKAINIIFSIIIIYGGIRMML